MDREVALASLGDMVAATSRPVLEADAVGRLLDRHKRPDSEGRLANDPDWTGAWDLNGAAAEGWRLKGAKVAGDFNFGADGASYSKADVLAHCLEMEGRYASKSMGVMSTLAGREPLPRDWDGTLIP